MSLPIVPGFLVTANFRAILHKACQKSKWTFSLLGFILSRELSSLPRWHVIHCINKYSSIAHVIHSMDIHNCTLCGPVPSEEIIVVPCSRIPFLRNEIYVWCSLCGILSFWENSWVFSDVPKTYLYANYLNMFQLMQMIYFCFYPPLHPRNPKRPGVTIPRLTFAARLRCQFYKNSGRK